MVGRTRCSRGVPGVSDCAETLRSPVARAMVTDYAKGRGLGNGGVSEVGLVEYGRSPKKWGIGAEDVRGDWSVGEGGYAMGLSGLGGRADGVGGGCLLTLACISLACQHSTCHNWGFELAGSLSGRVSDC